ncbi:MAG: PAS domain S-box protein [Candidatus Riflebacteria bacterium]|nr:PAS domain S-box protein [Candidatus Riflebacteria bacterium]
MDDLYERLLVFTEDAVYRYQYEDGVLLTANQGLVKVLGLTCPASDIVGRRLRDILVYTEKEGAVRAAIELTGEVHNFEYHFKTLSGEDRWVLHDSFLSHDPDTGQRVVEAIARDITARKQAELAMMRMNEVLEERVRQRTEELEAANEELRIFAVSMSHDLRAPVRHIESFSRLLLDRYGDHLDETGREYLDFVHNGSHQLASLIDELLKLFRLSRADLKREAVNLSTMAREIAAELQHADPERRAEFDIREGLVDEGDPTLLRTVLFNLLANAWKFTYKRPTSRIAVTASEGRDGRTYLVQDNGVGFEPAYAHKLFQPFQRLHKASEFPGSGIGLVSAQRIVARHQGRMWATGQPDQGASFYFTLWHR